MNPLMYVFYPLIFLGFCFDNMYSYVQYTKNRCLTMKQKAYILSIKSSLTMFIFSLYMNYRFAQASFDMATYISSSSEFHKSLEYINILVFTSYLFCDILVGMLMYPRYMMSLTGYAHHTIYIIFNFIAIVTNNQSVYLLYMMAELPTFILSIGTYDAKYRSDKLFGLTFLATRILYHIFLSSQAITYSTLLFTLSMAVLVMHMYWFKNWVCKYMFGKLIL